MQLPLIYAAGLPGTILRIVLAKTPIMKLDFGFYFRLLICTAVICALIYGLGGKAVEQHAIIAFGMLSSFMIGIGGMIRHLPEPATQKTGK